jgi:uncharacterized protein (UPF0332 family)
MIRYKRPDIKNAISILEAAKREMEFTLTISVKEEAGTTIIRNIYESFRMLGDALLTSKGIEVSDHLEQIGELFKLSVKTERPIQIIDNLRRLRHNMNYYGYKPNIEEVKDAILIAKACFIPLYNEVSKKIKESNK